MFEIHLAKFLLSPFGMSFMLMHCLELKEASYVHISCLRFVDRPEQLNIGIYILNTWAESAVQRTKERSQFTKLYVGIFVKSSLANHATFLVHENHYLFSSSQVYAVQGVSVQRG